jgi:hypothetical protein
MSLEPSSLDKTGCVIRKGQSLTRPSLLRESGQEERRQDQKSRNHDQSFSCHVCCLQAG